MTIYSPSGAVVYEAPITKSAIIRRELMGDYYIELVFDAVDRIDIGRGCYILYNNHRFEIMNNVIPDDTNQGGLRYTLRFESQQSQMKRCNVFWREGDNLEVSFALTSDISTFGQLIIDNVNAFLGGSTFSLGSVPSGAEMKAISFAGDSCWDAVATIAETFGVEWWTEEDGDNVRLCFGKLEVGESVEFKKGDIVSSIPSKKGDDANYGTRFYVFGSTKNLPEDYGSTVEGGITNNIVEKRLHLPDGMQYIDAWPNLAPEDIVEKTVFFEDVMPTNVETITEVYSGNAEVIPGTSHKVYDVVCANSPFTLDDVIEGETIQANFTSGSLNGQTFDLELTQTSGVFNKTFRIVPKILDKDSLTVLPQGEMIPRAGDTFILLNVNLPKGRINEAEQRLLEVGQEYVKKNSSDTEIYDCPTNAVYCHKNDCNYVLGQRVTLVGDMFGDGRHSRIQGYEKKLYDEYQATYTVGDNSAYSRLASLEKSIRQANYSDRVGLEANIIRSKNDATIPSDFNVYSALASEEYFLSKRKGGIVKGHTNFEKGISMYGVPIVYDEETKTWVLEGNLVTTRGISAWGSLSTPVASIFEALPIDGRTIKRDPVTNELYVDTTVVGGGGSGGGSVDPSQLEAYLKPYAKTADVESTYATIASLSAVTSRLNDFLSGSDTDAIINKWSELETFLAGLAETDNLATILSGKANKATTLAGYGITDAYTKSHIDSNFVTIGTKQQITGEKDFVGGFKVNGGLVEYNATLKAWVFNGDLLVTGGMAAFSNISGFKPSTITEAVLIDNKTIKLNADGLLYAVPQGAGGINDDQLADYLTTNGYATQSWVTGREYITSDALSAYLPKTGGYLTGNVIMTDGVTIRSSEGNVAGTLKFGADTANFRTILGTATRETLLIGTTAIKFWRGANSKEYTVLDSYNYADYALPKNGTAAAANTLKTSTDFLYTRTYDSSKIVNIGADATAEGYSTYIDGMFIRFRYGSAYTTAMEITSDGNVVIGGTTASEKLEVHGKVKATSFMGNASSASKLQNAVSLWGRSFDGSADLTGSLNVTTGEGYRITYHNYDLRFIVSGSSSNRGVWDGTNGEWMMYRNSSTDVFFPQGNVAIGSHTTPTDRLSVNGNINLSGAYNYKIQGKDVVSIYSTNYFLADSAIELGYNTFVVGRKINFQTSTTTTKTTTATLDGRGNFSITGVLNLPAVDSGFTNPRITFGDSVIRIGATTAGLLGVYASGDIRLNPNSASSANSTMGLWLKASGFNGINISNPTQALHVNGKGIFADATNPWVALQRNGENWYLQVVSTGLKLGKTSASGILVDASGNLVAPGGVTATNSSDERLKRNLRKFNASKVLMSLGGVYEYEYIDSEVEKNHIYQGTHFGLIYQRVKGTKLDVMCHEREDGFGTLNYMHQKFISLIAGATIENITEVETLKREIRHLKQKVKQLENRA